MSAIVAGIGLGAAALGQGIYGATQNAKASAIEKSNFRPVKSVDPIYQQNVNMAQNMAQEGLPQSVYNNQLNNINQNQAGAIASLNNSSVPGAGLASIVRQGNNATRQLNADDAAARNKNLLLLMQQRGILAGAKQDAWNYNYADKYSENLAKSQAYRGAGTQNIENAFGTLASGAGMIAGAGGLGGIGGGSVSAKPNNFGYGKAGYHYPVNPGLPSIGADSYTPDWGYVSNL